MTPFNPTSRYRNCVWLPARGALLTLVLIGLLTGCGGGSGGAPTVTNPGSAPAGGTSYSGPPPGTADIQAFRVNLWEPLRADNRCGNCHNGGGQVPQFVREDDVNLAYNAANTVVNLTSPALSQMVTKVAGGHNCWEAVDAVCADIITNYISAWAAVTVGGSGTQVQLTAPAIRDPGSSLNLPADPTLFQTYVHPLLTSHCANCHTETAGTPRSPFFANSDVASAYEAARSKINLNNPGNSRLVVRLRDEFHNCWGVCTDNAATMQAAIASMAAGVTPTQPDPALVLSKALTLAGDGIVASSGGRHEANQIAFWQFKTGQGSTAYDTSGVDPAINLSFSGTVNWVGGWGIQIVNGKAQGTTTASRKLHDMITATGEYTIEAWIAPGNVTQEDSHIIGYSGSNAARNFTLGQRLYNYEALGRSSTTDANGEAALATADADEDLQATLQHVVVTYDPVNGRQIYVNGVFTDDVDAAGGGNLADWDNSFAFVLGNEVSNDRLWQGTLRMVSIHNRALTQQQITQNFDVGVGEKFFLLFSVSHLVNVPDSFIVFEVSQYDSYSYLFNQPFFISLDPTAVPSGIALGGMRIGINGREATVGQAYSNVDITLDGSGYTPGQGQPISSLGTILALENGPQSDEFFLTFEQLGANTHVFVEASPPVPGTPTDPPAVSDIGVRMFNEIDAAMSQMTQVNRFAGANSSISTTYSTYEQQLPAVDDVNAFLASQQMAIAQLSMEYCSALVEDRGDSARSTYFAGFDFSAAADTAFDATGRAQIIDPLLTNMLNADLGVPVYLATQPGEAAVRTELEALITRLTQCATGGSPTCATTPRTLEVVKATCAAVLGSAAMLLQ
ncbi:MAG: LamG domain-containing protein [Proteobacteria bacterium]|nr:MAG: LamG domain-containing protein [Pseudomonadota bacterium]